MSGDAEVETARECIAQKEDTGALAKLKTLAGPQNSNQYILIQVFVAQASVLATPLIQC